MDLGKIRGTSSKAKLRAQHQNSAKTEGHLTNWEMPAKVDPRSCPVHVCYEGRVSEICENTAVIVTIDVE